MNHLTSLVLPCLFNTNRKWIDIVRLVRLCGGLCGDYVSEINETEINENEINKTLESSEIL